MEYRSEDTKYGVSGSTDRPADEWGCRSISDLSAEQQHVKYNHLKPHSSEEQTAKSPYSCGGKNHKPVASPSCEITAAGGSRDEAERGRKEKSQDPTTRSPLNI